MNKKMPLIGWFFVAGLWMSAGCSTPEEEQQGIAEEDLRYRRCRRTTCAAQGASCGTISDGCGGTLDCGACAGTADAGAVGPNPGSGTTSEIVPTVIPLSDAEIGNPWRGPLYYSSESPPPSSPLTDLYDRWCWGELEPAQGQYDFGRIDSLLARAKSQGGKAGIRVMPVNTSGQSGVCLPAYLRQQIGEPPDWNAPAYLDRVLALLTALGQRYDSDPRFGWYEIGPYGNWGEWNLAEIGGTPMSDANKQRLIQMSVQAFPHKRLIALGGLDSGDSGCFGCDPVDAARWGFHVWDGLTYALNLSPNIGLRADCLGKPDFGGYAASFAVPAAAQRWKTSPVILEYCGGPDFQTAQDQIVQYHAALIGDGAGNINSFGSYSSSDQQLMMLNYNTSGYRFVLDRLTVASTLARGSSFDVTSLWSNVGITPAYSAWSVVFQLKDPGTGQIAWEGTSRLDLQQLLPTKTGSGTDTPASVADHFTLPAAVAAGTYQWVVRVVDPEGYYRPLALAIQGRTSDGSYLLGDITVN
jgi:hypothetical protein